MRWVVGLALVGSACSQPQAPSIELTQVETHILAARDSDTPGSFVRSGRALAVWRRLGGQRVPVLESASSFTIAVPLAGAGNLTLRSLAGIDSPGRTGTARFEVSLLCPGGRQKSVLTSLTLPEGSPSTVRLDADARLPGTACQLHIDVVRGAASGRIFLVDPILMLRQGRSVSERPRVNLLLVTMDTTRADALGPWEGTARTPHLDGLAAEGIVFDDAHSVAFGTTPAHASLFTGQPAVRHGIYDNDSILSSDMETLAERLRDAGYQTAAFVGAAPVGHQVGLDQGFLLYDDLFADDSTSGLGEYSRFERRANVTVDRFEDWLEKRSEPTPFAVWLHFFDPHQPYAPLTPPPGEPPEIARLFLGERGAPAYLRSDSIPPNLSEAADRAAHRRYDAEIAVVDTQLGRAFDLLKARGVFGETLVVFLTDHGENFLDRGGALAWNHAGLLPEVTRTGLVLKLPRSELAGERVDQLMATSDVACLVTRSMGIEPARTWHCTDVLEALRSGHPWPARELVLEGAHRRELAVRSERWLLRQAGAGARDDVQRRDGFEPGALLQLYDLSVDSGARRDLIAAGEPPPAEQARFLRLLQAVRQLRNRLAPRSPVDAESHLEALRALGYVTPSDATQMED